MKIQRITLATQIDLQFETDLDLMNPAAFQGELESLVTRNEELGFCVVERKVLDVPKEDYNSALGAPSDELRELRGE